MSTLTIAKARITLGGSSEKHLEAFSMANHAASSHARVTLPNSTHFRFSVKKLRPHSGPQIAM